MNIDLDTVHPPDPEYTREVAEAAAEAIRTLNHHTLALDSGALWHPSDVGAVLRSLSSLADRLPQLCEQLGAWLSSEQAAGRLEMRGGKYADPALAVPVTALHLGRAAASAGQMRAALTAAASVTTDMAGRDDSSEEADGDG